MKVTESLATFLNKTRLSDIPEDTINYAEKLFLRAIGISVWGSSLPVGQISGKMTQTIGALPEVGVIGHSYKTTVDNAAFANGASIHAAEWDGPAHPDEVTHLTIFPISLGMAEKLNLSGAKMLEASILGFETQGRLSLSCPTSQPNGFFPLPVFGIFGAAATAAKCLDLTVDQTRATLGIAASCSNGSLRNSSWQAHYFESAIACRSAVTAAMLAKSGVSADLDAFDDGRYPGFGTMIAGKGNFKPERITDNLGKGYRIRQTYMKHFPCCMRMQRIMEAAEALVLENNIYYDKVDHVEIEVNSIFRAQLDRPNPRDFEEARFSIQHGIASALIDRHLGRDTFTDKKATDPKFREAGNKVKINVHPEWEPGFLTGHNTVTIYMKDGNKYSMDREKSKGHPETPFTLDEVTATFKECVGGILSPKQIERAIELAHNVRELKNLSELMQILTFPEGKK